MREPARRGKRQVLFRTAAGVLLGATISIAAASVAFAGLLWLWWAGDPGADQRSRGLNALWAAHTWVGDPHTDTEYATLARRLERAQISDVFFHAGPIEADGTVSPSRTRNAAALVRQMKKYAPAVRVQAYLGQIESRGGGPLDLDNPTVRDHVVATAGYFLDLGFDGIHYDIEPVFPADDAFLDLLDRTHRLTEMHHGVLSVALEQMEVAPQTRSLFRFVRSGYHDPTRAFLRQIAPRVDQVAIMTYDSGLPADWLFGSFVAWETEQVVRAIGDEVTVFMGVPTYDEGSAGRFYSWAENMDSGVRGVKAGLSRLDRPPTQGAGIAIFAEWTTSDEEWDTYYDRWIRD